VTLAEAALLIAFAGGSQAATVTVPAGNNWYCDASYQGGVCETSINVGDTVTWEMVAGTHTVTECDDTFSTCPPAGGGFDSGILNNGETFSHTFTSPDSVEYLCTLRRPDAGPHHRRARHQDANGDPNGPPSPTPSPSPTPGPPGYVLSQVVDTGKGLTTGLALVPGTADEAVLITQDGDLWKIDLSEPSQTPAPFGSVRDRMTKSGDEGLLGIVFEAEDASRVYVNYTRGTQYYRPYSRPGVPASTTMPATQAQPHRSLQHRQRRDGHGE
jgi:plastocyanin